ncbi:hypothetical protein ACJMK2_032614, partial [Sinanodonta woodiana]
MNHNSEFGNWTATSEQIFFNHFPLHRACRDGDYEALESLLTATGERDFYLEDIFYGWTPIHWAAYCGKLPCLMKLLEHNANCDVPTERLNQTPIHVAAYGGYGCCVKWLLHCGARINRQLCCLRKIVTILGSRVCGIPTSKFQQTPFHLSAQSGEPHCLQWLVQSGNCNINLQDYMGETPIHMAARKGSMECVSLLVLHGAKLCIRNLSGNTPSEVAGLAGHQECSNYLEKTLEMCRQENMARNCAAHPESSHSIISTDMSEINENAVRQCQYGNLLQQPFENNIIHENGKTQRSDSHTGPPKQYVSTDYQGSTTFVQNGVASMSNGVTPMLNGVTPMLNGVTPMLNGIVAENNNVLISHDCDIEMEAEGAPVGQKCNGMSSGIRNGSYENGVASGRMKRSREDADDGCIKRARSE